MLLLLTKKKFTSVNFNYYFHDLRKENSILSRRQPGVSSVMICSVIGYAGKIDTKRYGVINEQITSHATRIAGNNFILK